MARRTRIRAYMAGMPRAVPIVLLSGLLIAADSPTGGEPGVTAFVLSNIYAASPGEAGTCPVMGTDDLVQFYKSLPAAEQAKYSDPGKPGVLAQDKRQKLELAMNRHYGFRILFPGGKRTGLFAPKLPPSFKPGTVPTPEQALEIAALNNFPKGRGRLAFSNHVIVYTACSNPEDFPMLGMEHRLYEGKVAAGMNLDGKTSREDFTGLDGTKGVDNQLWRAIGCLRPFREGAVPAYAKKTFMSAIAPTLIELRGVDDPKNDADVEVVIYASISPVIRDGRGDALAGASFDVERDPKMTTVTKGRIVNGTLTTDPADIRVHFREQIVDAPREFRGARIRATLKEDGTIEGGIYGYYTLASYWSGVEQMTQNGANLSSISCPGIYRAVNRLADGYPDPKTGRNTAISAAFNFHGVRAFAVNSQQVRLAAMRK